MLYYIFSLTKQIKDLQIQRERNPQYCHSIFEILESQKKVLNSIFSETKNDSKTIMQEKEYSK